MTKLLRVPLEIRHFHHFHIGGSLEITLSDPANRIGGGGGDHSKVMS